MRTYLVKKDDRGNMVIDGLVTSKELAAIKQKIKKAKIKLNRRNWQKIVIYVYDFATDKSGGVV